MTNRQKPTLTEEIEGWPSLSEYCLNTVFVQLEAIFLLTVVMTR